MLKLSAMYPRRFSPSGIANAMILKRRGFLDRFLDRLAEPMHLGLASAVVALVGSYRAKIAFDVVRRRHYAYCTLRAADLAKERGLDAVTIVEFGVAGGDGLLNLCNIGNQVSVLTGVRIEVVGFDSGCGMPAPRDYRDHPDLYQVGDFPMNVENLKHKLPAHGRLILGDLHATVPDFMKELSPRAPLGFAAVDVDYYSSAIEAMALFLDDEPRKYLPTTLLYLDDIIDISNSRFTGELLAVENFNASHPMRKIDQHRFLRSERIFKNARWIDQIYTLHILDHPLMHQVAPTRAPKVYSDTLIAPELFPETESTDARPLDRVYALEMSKTVKASR
jgi:hypothetical protein